MSRLQPPPDISSTRFRGWLRDIWVRVAELTIGEGGSGKLVVINENGNLEPSVLTEIKVLEDDNVIGTANKITTTISPVGTVTLNIDDAYLILSVLGTTNQVTVTDNGDGTITLSAPQDLHTGATPTFDTVNFVDINSNITKDGSNNLLFTDAITGGKTLAQLAAVSVSTLQQSYDVSTAPQIIVTSAKGGVEIKDAATPVGADLLDIQDNAGNTLFATSVAQITQGRNMVPDVTETHNIGSQDNRVLEVFARRGDFVGGNKAPTRSPNSTYSIMAGRNFENPGYGVNTFSLGNASTTFPPLALFGSCFSNGLYTGTATLEHAGGQAFMAASCNAYAYYGANTAEVKSAAAAFGSFTGGYAYANRYCTGRVTILNEAKGAFVFAYPRNEGAGVHEVTIAVNSVGATVLGRTEGYGNAYLGATSNSAGAFVQGSIDGTAGTTGLIQAQTAAFGAFVQGRVNATVSGYTASISTVSRGTFVQGVAEGAGQIHSTREGSFTQGQAGGNGNSRITNGARGGFAQGRAFNDSTIFANLNGAFAQGHAINSSTIQATAQGAFARGLARGGYTIEATATGAHAMGDTTLSGPNIAATAVNAFQLGPGTNAVVDSLQIGSGFRAHASGQHAGIRETITLGVGVTTFVIGSQSIEVTGDAGANTIATITGGVVGQFLALQFVDSLVTITDDNTHAANSVDLNAAFTSADDTILFLYYDGISWYEISRSVN